MAIRITRVYTRTGDKGETRLVGGKKVPKDVPRIEAYGTIDELNSIIGLARVFLEAHLESRSGRGRYPWAYAHGPCKGTNFYLAFGIHPRAYTRGPLQDFDRFLFLRALILTVSHSKRTTVGCGSGSAHIQLRAGGELLHPLPLQNCT